MKMKILAMEILSQWEGGREKDEEKGKEENIKVPLIFSKRPK